MKLRRASLAGIGVAIGLSCAYGQTSTPVQPTPMTPADAASVTPAVPQPVADLGYSNGELKVDAKNVSLPDILGRLSKLLGIAIDIPREMPAESIPILHYGPGPAREVVASMLTDSHWNFAIQDEEANTGKIQSLLLIGPSGKGSAESEPGGRPGRSPYARTAEAMARPAQPEPAESKAQSQSDTAQLQASLPPPESSPAPDTPAALPETAIVQSTPAALVDASRPISAGALAPPATLDSQNINTQLQQMYQQRMQMIQQSRQTGPAAAPNAPGK